MAEGFGGRTDSELLAVLDAVLDALGDDRPRLQTDREQLELLAASLRVDARLRAWQGRLAARVEASEAAWHEHGTSATSWLAETLNLTRREAARIVAAGQGLERFGIVATAAGAGEVLPAQAEAITGVLDALPVDFPDQAVQEAQGLMVGFAATHNASELRRLSGRLLEVLDPDGADEREEARLEREHRLALRNRHLRFGCDQEGSVLFRGSLPVAEAEPFIRIIDAYAAAARRGLDRLDPHAEHRTAAMWRADALVAMVAHHTQEALAPTHGGDRPRVVVTLSYDKLAKAATDAAPWWGELQDGRGVPAGVLRRWLCDADLLPVVLGGPSEVLDVGRTQRLVTPAIRAALEVRDGGCAFPGCDRPPRDCHAHHIVPWWAGGATSLGNLALVCAHHHGIVEPGHDPAVDRWQLRLRSDGVPEVLPPLRVDPGQRPRVHARFLPPRRGQAPPVGVTPGADAPGNGGRRPGGTGP